jgi:hypothetical protein
MVHERQVISVERSPDAIDDQSASSEDCSDRTDHTSRMLRNIKAALSRIQEGTFGICCDVNASVPPGWTLCRGRHSVSLASAKWKKESLTNGTRLLRPPEEQMPKMLARPSVRRPAPPRARRLTPPFHLELTAVPSTCCS